MLENDTYLLTYSYKHVHDKNPYKNNVYSHLYKDVHDENPYKKYKYKYKYK